MFILLDQHAIKLNPSFSMFLATGQELLTKRCILAWTEQEAIKGDNNFRLMLEAVCVHTLFWADGPMLGVVSSIQLPQYQGHDCHILASKTLLRGINWQSLAFSHQGFSHNLGIHSTEIPQPGPYCPGLCTSP